MQCYKHAIEPISHRTTNRNTVYKMKTARKQRQEYLSYGQLFGHDSKRDVCVDDILHCLHKGNTFRLQP